ncbi:MAG: glycosyltransferase family 9 protein [Selenomonas sp.]|uniref:glycosyltransferase family 9 protein n=1 Tax=Selenomonas sp. TaxID=2053611 RepID=UPI0025FBE34A|nr:glycosyltransferase family 9 protein [Selenomonas sp.]MCR5757031.1 glycosyltransferase family 9 protein [Selenomonas sp.]
MKNFLIVKLSAIGDVIHALPVAYALKEAYSDCHITWVVEPPAFDLVEMCPYIDEVILFEKKKFKSLGGFLREYGPLKRKIRQRRYDAVLDLQGLFKSAAIARLGQAPVKLGMCNMRELSDRVSKPVIGPNAHGHIVERYLDVARALGCPVHDVRFTLEVPEREADFARQIFSQAGANMSNPYVVLAIGANWPNKRWPAECFAKLSDKLYDKKLIPVLVGGGIVDEQRAAEICSYSDIPPLNLVGRTNFKQLTYILQNARLTVGGDTGPVHLSAGMGTKTVMVMGPTDANRNGPYGQLENAIEVNRSCRYCWQRACSKKYDCLEDITVNQVVKKIEEIL